MTTKEQPAKASTRKTTPKAKSKIKMDPVLRAEGDPSETAASTMALRKAPKEPDLKALTDDLSNVLLGEKIPLDVVHAMTGEIIIPANRKITLTLIRRMAKYRNYLDIDPSPIRNKVREILARQEHREQQDLATDNTPPAPEPEKEEKPVLVQRLDEADLADSKRESKQRITAEELRQRQIDRAKQESERQTAKRERRRAYQASMSPEKLALWKRNKRKRYFRNRSHGNPMSDRSQVQPNEKKVVTLEFTERKQGYRHGQGPYRPQQLS